MLPTSRVRPTVCLNMIVKNEAKNLPRCLASAAEREAVYEALLVQDRALRGVATYEDVYRLTYLRGPDGFLLMLAQDLTRE